MRSSLLLLGLSALVSAHSKHAVGANGAVASESKVCSQIGIDTLKDGGNAADAVSKVRKRTSSFHWKLTIMLAYCPAILCGSNWHVPLRRWRRRLHDRPILEGRIRVH
jgi:hypothetical protein